MSLGSSCPLGEHYVRSHPRSTKKGMTQVSAHCRKNPKGKENLLYASNLRHIYYSSEPKNYSKLPAIKGFRGFHKYDLMIQFWTEYWKDKKVLHEQVDPLLIKALIAAESSFRPRVRTQDPRSTAAGLMQITGSTLRTLKGDPDHAGYIEVKDYPIYLEKDEHLDPLVNIATGIRWLGHKIKELPKRYKSKDISQNIFNGFKYYHSWNQEGENHAKKVYRYYNETLSQ